MKMPIPVNEKTNVQVMPDDNDMTAKRTEQKQGRFYAFYCTDYLKNSELKNLIATIQENYQELKDYTVEKLKEEHAELKRIAFQKQKEDETEEQPATNETIQPDQKPEKTTRAGNSDIEISPADEILIWEREEMNKIILDPPNKEILMTSFLLAYDSDTNSIDSTTYLKHKPLSLVSLKAVCDMFGIKIRK